MHFNSNRHSASFVPANHADKGKLFSGMDFRYWNDFDSCRGTLHNHRSSCLQQDEASREDAQGRGGASAYARRENEGGRHNACGEQNLHGFAPARLLHGERTFGLDKGQPRNPPLHDDRDGHHARAHFGLRVHGEGIRGGLLQRVRQERAFKTRNNEHRRDKDFRLHKLSFQDGGDLHFRDRLAHILLRLWSCPQRTFYRTVLHERRDFHNDFARNDASAAHPHFEAAPREVRDNRGPGEDPHRDRKHPEAAFDRCLRRLRRCRERDKRLDGLAAGAFEEPHVRGFERGRGCERVEERCRFVRGRRHSGFQHDKEPQF